MSVFPDWEQYAVPQKRGQTGCIPTGYEMLLKAAHVQGVDFDTFQDDFDLIFNGSGQNDFKSIAAAVNKKYPHIEFESKEFKTGGEKLRFVEERLKLKKPTLISLAIVQNGKLQFYHIMPVVDADEDNLLLLWCTDTSGNKKTMKLTKKEFARLHDEVPGGNDVAFVKEP